MRPLILAVSALPLCACLSTAPRAGRSTCQIGRPCCEVTSDGVSNATMEDAIRRLIDGKIVGGSLSCCPAADEIESDDGKVVRCLDVERQNFDIDELRFGHEPGGVAINGIRSTCREGRPCCDVSGEGLSYRSFATLLNRLNAIDPAAVTALGARQPMTCCAHAEPDQNIGGLPVCQGTTQFVLEFKAPATRPLPLFSDRGKK